MKPTMHKVHSDSFLMRMEKQEHHLEEGSSMVYKLYRISYNICQCRRCVLSFLKRPNLGITWLWIKIYHHFIFKTVKFFEDCFLFLKIKIYQDFQQRFSTLNSNMTCRSLMSQTKILISTLSEVINTLLRGWDRCVAAHQDQEGWVIPLLKRKWLPSNRNILKTSYYKQHWWSPFKYN